MLGWVDTPVVGNQRAPPMRTAHGAWMETEREQSNKANPSVALDHCAGWMGTKKGRRKLRHNGPLAGGRGMMEMRRRTSGERGGTRGNGEPKGPHPTHIRGGGTPVPQRRGKRRRHARAHCTRAPP